MGWWNQKAGVTPSGAAFFRGRWSAQPQDLASVSESGVRLGPMTRTSDGWTTPMEHDRWGRATLRLSSEYQHPPPVLVEADVRLSASEKIDLLSCETALVVSAEPRTGNVLADRKDLLRFLSAVMGQEGVAALDHTAQAFWSRDNLTDELSHDAELDIDAIYTVHALSTEASPPEEPRTYWLHTHGLRDLGFWDFDILDPGPALLRDGFDIIRALAFASVEGRLAPDAEPFRVMNDERVRAVAAADFAKTRTASAFMRYAEGVDDDHIRGHAVLCDPDAPGLLRSLIRGSGPTPAHFLVQPLPERAMITFSPSASDLMQRRAIAMLPLLRTLCSELAEFHLPIGVKLRFRVDGGGPDDLEHVWFDLHGFRGDVLEATAINAPRRVSSLRPNVRGEYPPEMLTDWAIWTPFGQISPRRVGTVRFIRKNPELTRKAVAEARGEKAEG